MAEKTVVVEREAEVREEGLAEEERAAAASGGVEGVATEKTVDVFFSTKMPEHPGICSNHLKMLVGHLMVM